MHLIDPPVSDLDPPVCPSCGEPFEKSRKWQIFCSSKCRNIYHNDQNRKYSDEIELEKAALINERNEFINKIVPEIIKCPFCNTDSSQPNMLELISPGKYLCNSCSKDSTLVLEEMK
jgi:endogenous inhibitor of DNA gyrase (YacG/DUF329 family)